MKKEDQKRIFLRDFIKWTRQGRERKIRRAMGWDWRLRRI